MPDAIEFNPEDINTPVSVTIDTDLSGAFLLARLCQFAYEIESEDDGQIMDIYSQIINQIDKYGSYVSFDSEESSDD
jgi:transcription elongation factor Elf1